MYVRLRTLSFAWTSLDRRLLTVTVSNRIIRTGCYFNIRISYLWQNIRVQIIASTNDSAGPRSGSPKVKFSDDCYRWTSGWTSGHFKMLIQKAEQERQRKAEAKRKAEEEAALEAKKAAEEKAAKEAEEAKKPKRKVV